MSDGSTPADENDFLRFQLQQALDTVRHETALLVQVTGFLVALDSVLFAYGVSQGKAILLLAASAVPGMALVTVQLIVRHVAPVAYVALQAELRLSPEATGLVATYLRTRMPRLYGQIEPFARAGGAMPIDRSLDRKIGYRFWAGRSGVAMATTSFAQLAVFVLSVTVFGFRFT
jgi:hypothetical protein